MKKLALFLFVVFIFLEQSNAFSQLTSFTPNIANDSSWISQLKTQLNEQEPYGSSVKWIGGKVTYTPDKHLRIAQIAGSNDTTTYLKTFIQYNYNGILVEKKLSDDYTLSSLPVEKIYPLKGKKNSYLFLNMVDEYEGDDESYSNVNDWLHDFLSQIANSKESKETDDKLVGIRHIASVLEMDADTITQIYFQSGTRWDDYAMNFTGNTLEVLAMEDSTECGHEYLLYDSTKQQLEYLNVSTVFYENDISIKKVEKGMFEYRDSVFHQIIDIAWFCPLLKTFRQTLSTKKYSVGKYAIKETITKEYEEVGMGILQYENHYYDIGKLRLKSSFQKDGENYFPKPDFKLQADGSLIVMEKLFYSPNRPGMCGNCPYEEYTIYRIQNNKSTKLITLSFNVGDGRGSYEYNDCKGQNQSKYFYLDTPENDRYSDYSLKWKNNSTLLVKLTDGISSRSFTIHFDVGKYKHCTTITTGKKMNVQKSR